MANGATSSGERWIGEMRTGNWKTVVLLLSIVVGAAQTPRPSHPMSAVDGDLVFDFPPGWTGHVSKDKIFLSSSKIPSAQFPAPGTAFLSVSLVRGTDDETKRDIDRILVRERNKGVQDATWSFRVVDGQKVFVRHIRWEAKTPGRPAMSDYVNRLLFIWTHSSTTRVYLEYWKGDPRSREYEDVCTKLVLSARRAVR